MGVSYNQLSIKGEVTGIVKMVQDTRSHHSLLIDVAGQSDDEHAVGIEYHVGVDNKNEASKWLLDLCLPIPRKVERKRVLACTPLEPRIRNLGGHWPEMWGTKLHEVAQEVFREMTKDGRAQLPAICQGARE